jgi:hypothetical protein
MSSIYGGRPVGGKSYFHPRVDHAGIERAMRLAVMKDLMAKNRLVIDKTQEDISKILDEAKEHDDKVDSLTYALSYIDDYDQRYRRMQERHDLISKWVSAFGIGMLIFSLTVVITREVLWSMYGNL